MSTFQLDAAQQQAVAHPLSPLRIIAGAGSGKTEVMAQRVVALVESGAVADHHVLGLTFSNKAAANLRARIVKRLGPSNRVQVSTYHGFGAQLVNEFAVALNLPTHPRLLDRARAFQLLLAEFDRVDLPNRKTGRPQSIVDEALALASSCADHLVPITQVRSDCEAIIANPRATFTARRAARSRLDLCTLVDAYAVAKRRMGYLDFGDQIALAVAAMRENPDLVPEIRDRYRAVLLDEFQDTNVAQRELLKLIWVDDQPAGSAPLTVVGDDLQAIYGFRGAHVNNLIGFAAYVTGTVDVRLETNYRSGEPVVSLANHIQANLPGSLSKVLRAHSTLTAEVESFVASDDRHEAQTIADQIASIGAPWNEIAILCRKRRLMGPIQAALRERSIPVDIVGIGGLLSKPEVLDTIAWMQVMCLPESDPAANIAVLRLLQGRQFRFGLRDLAALSRADRDRRKASMVDASSDETQERLAPPVDPGLDLRRVALSTDLPELSVEAWRRLNDLRAIADSLRPSVERHALVDVLEAIMDRASLWSAVDETGHENLLRFLHLAHIFAPLDGPTTVTSFLHYLELVELSEDEPAEASVVAADAVQLMTIHQAKGLEFDTVFVPGLAGSGSSKIFPDSRSTANGATVAAALPHWLRLDNDGFSEPPCSKVDESRLTEHVKAEQEAEEKRLLYVAVTRARRRLVVSAAHWYSGPQKPQGVSSFYEMLSARTDLVKELFRSEGANENPATAAKRQRQDQRARKSESSETSPIPTRKRSRHSSEALFEFCEVPRVNVRDSVPPSLTATGLVTYAQCPQRYAWTYQTPMPRRPNTASSFGQRVHSWIEQRNLEFLGGQDFQEMPNLSLDSSASRQIVDRTDPEASRREQQSQEGFLRSPYSKLKADRVESAFLLSIGDMTVLRGRVDAAYWRDGQYEIVDFKTGRSPHPNDASSSLQLDLYALVAVDLWGIDPETLSTTYCYLVPQTSDQGDLPALLTTQWSGELLIAARKRVAQYLKAIQQGRFSPHGGSWCATCDFATFCPGAEPVRSTS